MPQITSVPPGFRALIECDQVAAPTVSITASTRSGSRAPIGRPGAPGADCSVTSRRITRGDPDAHPGVPAEGGKGNRHPAACALNQYRVAGPGPDWLKSIRYAVSQAVGRQAASAKLNSGGLSTRLAGGTRRCVAKVPG